MNTDPFEQTNIALKSAAALVDQARDEIARLAKERDQLRADLHEAAELLRDKVLEITCDVRWERRRDSFLAKLKSLGLL